MRTDQTLEILQHLLSEDYKLNRRLANCEINAEGLILFRGGVFGVRVSGAGRDRVPFSLRALPMRTNWTGEPVIIPPSQKNKRLKKVDDGSLSVVILVDRRLRIANISEAA